MASLNKQYADKWREQSNRKVSPSVSCSSFHCPVLGWWSDKLYWSYLPAPEKIKVFSPDRAVWGGRELCMSEDWMDRNTHSLLSKQLPCICISSVYLAVGLEFNFNNKHQLDSKHRSLNLIDDMSYKQHRNILSWHIGASLESGCSRLQIRLR